MWAIYNNAVYDLSDYINTVEINTASQYSFLNSDIVDIFKQQPGQDITKPLNNVLAGLDSTTRDQNMQCINNMFYYGEPDFRKDARCQVQNVLLLVFSIILLTSIGVKCKFSWLIMGARCLTVLYSLGCSATVAQTQSRDAR